MANPNAVIDRSKTGRAKGTTNKVTKELKDMILGALSDVGGQKYLAMQAIENPGPFMSLIGKVLPKDVSLTANVTNTIEYKPATEYLEKIIDRLNAVNYEQKVISSTPVRHQEH